MEQPDLVQALIDNERTSFTKDDKDWLTSLSEEQLKKLVPKTNETEKTEETEETQEEEPAKVSAPETPAANQDIESLVDAAVAKKLATIQTNQEKERIIGTLKANGRCKVSEEDLKAMSLEGLKSLATSFPAPSFDGRGGMVGNTMQINPSNGDGVPPMPKLVEKKK